MEMPSESSTAEKLLQVLLTMTQCCEAQIECIRAGNLSRVEIIRQEKEQLLEEMTRFITEVRQNPKGLVDAQDRIREALDAYMAMETDVQNALSERSGKLMDKLITHYKARLGQEEYENIAQLFTPIARLFPDSSRYIDERR
jgi:predicted nucleic-acid-binding protein